MSEFPRNQRHAFTWRNNIAWMDVFIDENRVPHLTPGAWGALIDGENQQPPEMEADLQEELKNVYTKK